jgi:hypothetical protein
MPLLTSTILGIKLLPSTCWRTLLSVYELLWDILTRNYTPCLLKMYSSSVSFLNLSILQLLISFQLECHGDYVFQSARLINCFTSWFINIFKKIISYLLGRFFTSIFFCLMDPQNFLKSVLNSSSYLYRLYRLAIFTETLSLCWNFLFYILYDFFYISIILYFILL